jgi:Holliday junction resolvasome RuvABC DNA-binding subunit
MTPEQIFRREKLITAWRAFAQGLTNLGYDPSEVLETMATVARNGPDESGQAAPKQAVQEEGRMHLRLPPATWDFNFKGRVAEH